MFIINEKIIFKKFLTENTYFFLLATLSMSFIVWVIQAVNHLDIVSEDGHSFLIYFYYMLLNLPKVFGKILPIMFFTSLFYTLIKYENNNELKVFWMNGINKIKFYNVILRYTLVFFIIQILLSSVLAPYLQNKARNHIKDSTLDFFPSLFQEKKFIDTVDKLTIFIESKNSQNQFKNIYLKDETNDFPRIIFAKKGELLQTDKARILRLWEGKFININDKKATTFNFEKTDFNLSRFLTKSITHRKLQETDIVTLVTCIINFSFLKNALLKNEDTQCNKDSINETTQEVYNRIFKPLYLFLLAAIACFLLVGNYENNNFKRLKSFVFILGVITVFVSEISVNYSGIGSLNLIITSLFPLIIFFIIYIFFLKKFPTN